MKSAVLRHLSKIIDIRYSIAFFSFFSIYVNFEIFEFTSRTLIEILDYPLSEMIVHLTVYLEAGGSKLCHLLSFIVEIQARQRTGLLPSKHACL